MAWRAELALKSVMLEVYGGQPPAERAPEFAGLTKRAKPAAAAALAEQNRSNTAGEPGPQGIFFRENVAGGSVILYQKDGGSFIQSRNEPAPTRDEFLLWFAVSGSILARGAVTDRLVAEGFVFVAGGGGQAAFRDGSLARFTEIVIQAADAVEADVNSVLRLNLDNGSWLPEISDEYFLRLMNTAPKRCFLPTGTKYVPHANPEISAGFVLGFASKFTPMQQCVSGGLMVCTGARDRDTWMKKAGAVFAAVADGIATREWPQPDAPDALPLRASAEPDAAEPSDALSGLSIHAPASVVPSVQVSDSTPMPDAPAGLRLGVLAVVQGLQRRADLNGRLVNVIGDSEQDGRWAVMTYSAAFSGHIESFKAKTVNLRPHAAGFATMSLGIITFPSTPFAVLCGHFGKEPPAPLADYVMFFDIVTVDMAGLDEEPDSPDQRWTPRALARQQAEDKKRRQREMMVEELMLAGFVISHQNGGSACFKAGYFPRFWKTARAAATKHNILIGNIFRLKDPGLGLGLSDDIIMGLFRNKELTLPLGAAFRPLKPKNRRFGVWGSSVFAEEAVLANSTMAAAA